MNQSYLAQETKKPLETNVSNVFLRHRRSVSFLSPFNIKSYFLLYKHCLLYAKQVHRIYMDKILT